MFYIKNADAEKHNPFTTSLVKPNRYVVQDAKRILWLMFYIKNAHVENHDPFTTSLVKPNRYVVQDAKRIL